MGTEKTSFHLAIIIVAAFVFLMLAVFFLLLYRQQKKLLLLQQEKNTDAMMRSEKERSEMAMQLHNEIVPYLAGVKLRLRMIQDHHADIQSACLPGLENSLQAIRGLSKKMAPMGIFRESFVEAIEHYVESTGMGDNLSVELHVKAMPEIEYVNRNPRSFIRFAHLSLPQLTCYLVYNLTLEDTLDVLLSGRYLPYPYTAQTKFQF